MPGRVDPLSCRMFRPLAAALLGCLLPAYCVYGQEKTAAKPELFQVIPEPRAMRSSISRAYADSQLTVFTPAKLSADGRHMEGYSAQEFARIGIGWESFIERSRAAADRKLATVQPQLIKDAAGRVIYGVYRGASPETTCLLLAPSLGKVFQRLFGDVVWVVTPDQHSLYVFPAQSKDLSAFAGDLRERFDRDAYAASEEIFEIKADGSIHVVGNFTRRQPKG